MPAQVFGTTDSAIEEELEEINETLENIYEVEVFEQGSSLGVVGEVIVTNVSTMIRNASVNRKAITIKNIGSSIVYITIDSAATLQGFPVDPEGVLELEGYFGDITGITLSGSVAVRYIEIV